MNPQQQTDAQTQHTLDVSEAMEILRAHLRANPNELTEIVVSMAEVVTGVKIP